jgi:hypothetical protein
MKIVFIALALVLGGVAVFFVISGGYEKAFVAATLGAVSWMLHYRQTLKEKLPKEDEYEEDLDEEESDEEVRS